MKKYIIFLICFLSISFSSCEDEKKIELTTDELARDGLYTTMKYHYLWDELMPQVNKNDYSNPYDLLEGMRYRKLDRWSYVQDYQEHLRQDQAIFVGHGIRIGLDENNKTRIVQIYNKSQLYAQGVRRGWIIKKLNGVELAPIFIAHDGDAYNTLMGPSQAGITTKFLFEMPDGQEIEISNTKATFTANTVIHFDTLELTTGTAGHIVFEQFVSASENELKNAFEFFEQHDINNLIVDLRYNGGGSLAILQNLAAHVAGSGKFNKEFLKYVHNEQQKSRNSTINFSSVASSVDMKRIVVITTRGTASASEDFINGLKPFMDIKIVGDTTHGKPVGMQGFVWGTKYIFFPITFTIQNTENYSDFYEGFAPDKYVIDDIAHDWNDRNEACLKEAINIIENGFTVTKSEYQHFRPTIFSEGKRPNFAFMINN